MSEFVTIKSNDLEVTINSFGAEISSVKGKDGTEFMWNGDPEYWTGRAPILFPICGALKGGKYTYGGAEYALPQHGFARRSVFSVETREESGAVFSLSSSDATREVYPFEFKLEVEFEVCGNELEISFHVRNMTDGEMYFSIGSHEAYACPEGVENYTIEFGDGSESEIPVSFIDPVTKTIAEITEPLTLQSGELELCDKLFERDAMVMRHPKFSEVCLKKKGSAKSIRVSFPEHSNFLLWKKPCAKFLCIEPWCGINDLSGKDGKLNEKADIICLEKNGTHTVRHTISFTE